MKKIIIFILFLVLLTGCQENKYLEKNFFYMDTYINVKLYNVKNAERAFDKIDEIYKEYHELADRYHNYEDLKNVYYIKNNNDTTETIKLDSRLCNMIELGMEYNQKTNGKFNINMADILDVWASYRENKNGVPTINELKEAKNKIKPIIFKEKCEILNNHPSIDLGAIAKGYATEKVGEYLKSEKIDKFIINAGGNVLVGNHYNNAKYKIGLETPNQEKSIYKVLRLENKSVVTSGGYERFYTYNGENYHHIIDYETFYPANYFKSVTVIADDSGIADALSTSLFLLPIEEGKKLIKNTDVQVVWYINDNQIVATEGISKYE